MRLYRSLPALPLCALLLACGGEHDAVPAATSVPAPAASQPPAAGPETSATASASSEAASVAAPGLPKDMNVLVLTVDSLRADRMLVAGYPDDVVPTLNQFAKEAVTYTQFQAMSSYTAQSLGGFLGARYPSELMRSGYFFAAYPPEELLFPELIQKAGISTMSAHAHFYFAPEKAGFHQGFDTYELIPGLKKSNTTDENITSPRHTEIILKHLSDPKLEKGQFFAYYHLLDPHDQYIGHPEGKKFGKGASGLYDGELYFTDMHIKKVLDHVAAQPWGKRTMVIVSADHGEAFGEHKMYRHGFELWNVLTHVPLMIRAPGLVPRVIDTPRGMIDLPKTILSVLGVPADPSFQGESLMPELLGGEAKPRDVITDLARTSDNDRRRTLIRGDFKIIELGDGDGYQLFDLKSDPGEKTDLARKNKEKLEELKGALKTAAEKIKERCPQMTEKLKGRKKGRPC